MGAEKEVIPLSVTCHLAERKKEKTKEQKN